MKNFLVKFATIILLLLVIRPVSANVSLVVLGDSLSAGYGMSKSVSWVGILERRWQDTQPDVELVNASISGETTQGALRRLPGVIERHQPQAVFVELGGNDGLRGFSLATVRDNLNQIIDQLQQRDIVVGLSQIQIPPNYGKRFTEMFASMYPELAEQNNIRLVPFFMEQIAVDADLMQNDGIHPNEQAQETIANIMEPLLLELVAEARKEKAEAS